MILNISKSHFTVKDKVQECATRGSHIRKFSKMKLPEDRLFYGLVSRYLMQNSRVLLKKELICIRLIAKFLLLYHMGHFRARFLKDVPASSITSRS